jgi:hypothetical protein
VATADVRHAVRRAVGPALDLVRRGRPVAWTPPFMGFGNHALLWFWAWRGRGASRTVLRTASMAPWLSLFPAAQALTVDRSSVGFLDRRLNPVDIPGERGAPPHTIDWTAEELHGFVTELLLSSREFRGLASAAGIGDGDLVVNVRRGDYYSPENVGRWGYDQASFLSQAVTAAHARDPVDRVVVVSDDPGWCDTRLGGLAEVVPRVDVRPPDDGPARNLATLVAARRLVLTNSSFSYWGGYIGDVLDGGARREVVAPWLFDREQNDGRSWLLSPGWTVVEDPDRAWSSPVE